MHRCLFVTARIVFVASLVFAASQQVLAEEPVIAAEHEKFFETRIRPLIVESCQECHSRDYAEAGVQLDSRSAILRGGESGQMVALGNPDASRLIEVVTYKGDVQMPPSEKLSDEQIADLRRWVELGLPWPAGADDAPTDEETPTELAETPYERLTRQHWAFQPVAQPAVPAVKHSEWACGDIDRFVLAKLEAEGLMPSDPAERQVLIRRATYDLIGLPPTYDEVQAFLADESPDAFARVIDRLLASPHYGERWGRHWLDVARYADTKGYVFTAEPKYPYSYTYRDYVVQAFNEDKPFDQFVIEQLAADHLELGNDKQPLAALGFLTLGRRFNNNIHDIIDDRIDVVTRGLMGVSVSCARCHDHKYDPIPTADYYSLYGIFASSHEPEEHPLIGDPQDNAAYDAFVVELNKRQQTLDEYLAEQLSKVQSELRTQVGAYLTHLAGGSVDSNNEDPAVAFSKGEVKPPVVQRWRQMLEANAKQHDPVFAPWHALAAAGEQFTARMDQLLAELQQQDQPELAVATSADVIPASGPTAETPALLTGEVNPLVRSAIVTKRPVGIVELAAVYGELFAQVHQQWETALQTASEQMVEAPTALLDPAAEQLRQVLMADGTPTTIKPDQLPPLLNRAQQDKRRNLQAAIDSHKANSVGAPPRAMVLLDSPTPHQPHIFLRGNPARRGDAVPRQFLSLLRPEARDPYTQGSGRLELAREIASADNPLTARVMVNRVWQHHFGHGIVRTSSDFGTRGEPPTHSELLDYLAQRFTDQGWSLKQLHREIMLSATYQQQSSDRPDCAAADPENRLLWRMNRRRLEFEPLRDSLLAVSGQLDRQIGGRPVDLFTETGSTRRSVYGFIDRQDLPGVFRAFNLASPDVSSPDRPQTTVPQQALYVMNSPFVIAQAKALAERVTTLAGSDTAQERVETLYELALSRPATEAEVELSVNYLAIPAAEGSQLSRWEQLAQVLLLTNEFAFVD